MKSLKGIFGSSTPSPAPSTPWRKIPSEYKKDDDLKYIREFQLKEGVEHIRIMFYGPTGAGKSSSINSVETTLRGRMTCQALPDSIGGSSFTTRYQTHEIKKDSESFYPFVFSDLMGLEKDNRKGVNFDDMVLALKGHMKNGYEYNQQTPLSGADEENYNYSPTINDKTHVLVCVVPATTVSILENYVIQKMRAVRLAAADLGIPQMAILTKIDEACPEVQKNIKDVYKSEFIKKQVEKLHAHLGIPLNYIFPVKNYHCEVYPDDDIDTLILMALKCMIQLGEDFVDKSLRSALV